MSRENIAETIWLFFRKKPILLDIGGDDDFFDLGVSSLTIVDLQIDIEKALEVSIPTSHLMKLPTVNQWVHAFTEALNDKNNALA